MLLNFVTRHSLSEDVLLYRKLVLSGNLYEYFGSVMKQKGLTQEDGSKLRKVAKKALFTAYFSHNRATNTPGLKVFKELFPHVYEIFRIIKDGQHNALACLLQNIEADIVLHRTCKEINEINPEIALFTIHDSIATWSEHIQLVKDVLSKHIYLALDAYPEIKIEHWDDSLLNQEDNCQSLPQKKMYVSTDTQHCQYGYAPDTQLYSIQEVAKNFGIGKIKFYAALRIIGVLESDDGLYNKPCYDSIKQDFLRFKKNDSNGKISFTVQVTDDGIYYLKSLIDLYPELFPARRPSDRKSA